MLQVQVITVDVDELTTDGLFEKAAVLKDSMNDILKLVAPLSFGEFQKAASRVRQSKMYQEYQGAFNDCATELVRRGAARWENGILVDLEEV